MSEPFKMSAVSGPRKKLLMLMSRYPFCRIENLEIRDKEPVFDPPPVVIQEIRLCSDNRSQQRSEGDEFVLRSPITELLENFNRIRDGRILVIEVKHSQPFRLMVEHSASEAEEQS